MKLVAWGKTDTGRKRDHNEDNYLVDFELGLFAVADGMGGHQGGHIASRLALEVLRREVADSDDDYRAAASRYLERAQRTTQPIDMDELATLDMIGRADTPPVDTDDPTDPSIETAFPPATQVMRAAAREAGHAVFDAALEDTSLRGMGTTLTAMLYDAGRMHVVHAGDSRAFLFRDNQLEQLTEDHSWIAEQVRAGAMSEEEAKESKFRHIITRSVGFERDVEIDCSGVAAEAGDCFLLCSDGVTNFVENPELELLFGTTRYRRMPQLLIDLANERGGDDNITVVVIYIGNDRSGADD
ncbi:MAG: serine/threonine-protein phosphatase [Deltaproteobacteria bacterium]|nr:serine/threonine-protein phosphatase [Deltaproteobacteria bacterium]